LSDIAVIASSNKLWHYKCVEPAERHGYARKMRNPKDKRNVEVEALNRLELETARLRSELTKDTP
jgi:hypothetical protein